MIVTAFDAAPTAAKDRACPEAGTWLDPGTGESLAWDDLSVALAGRPVVLLGEAHNNAEHHRWQLHTLAALHGRKSDVVLGFEAFPRRVQPALDRWVRGELSVEAFLEAADWKTVWAMDPALYLPLFHFARRNRIPMVALNVDRELVARVGREGWAAIPEEERAGLSDPRPASPAYRESLAAVYARKQARGLKDGQGKAPPDDGAPAEGEDGPDLAAIMESAGFARFVEAQSTWDRAMAEALAGARRASPGSLVIGVIGRGHIEHSHGVPQQLVDLGIGEAAILLPVDRAAACEDLPSDLADAVFVVDTPDRIETAQPKPRLGIMIEESEEGVRITKVFESTVAEDTGLEAGDVVLLAAGFPVGRNSDLIEIVQRQAPGTWLPMTIKRQGAELEIVAKFPTSFHSSE